MEQGNEAQQEPEEILTTRSYWIGFPRTDTHAYKIMRETAAVIGIYLIFYVGYLYLAGRSFVIPLDMAILALLGIGLVILKKPLQVSLLGFVFVIYSVLLFLYMLQISLSTGAFGIHLYIATLLMLVGLRTCLAALYFLKVYFLK